MTGQTLGFVGVGRMGGPMSGRCWMPATSSASTTRNPAATKPLAARGAKVPASAKLSRPQRETVFISLPTPDIVKAVAMGEAGVIAGSR